MIKRYKHNKIHRAARTKFRILKGSKVVYKLVARRSNKYISAQVINLKSGATVAGVKAKKASEVELKLLKRQSKLK
jgi:ribosomal protein L18